MNCKLKDGILNLPKEPKSPIRWRQKENQGMIPRKLQEYFLQDVKRGVRPEY